MTGSTVSIRLRAYRGEQHDTTECFNGLRDEAADLIDSLIAERDRLRAEVANLREAVDTNDAAFIDRMTAERDRLRELLLEAMNTWYRFTPYSTLKARIDAALKEKP